MHLVFRFNVSDATGCAGHAREGCAAQERGAHETRAWRAGRSRADQGREEEEVSGGPWWTLGTTKMGISHDI